MDARPVCAPLLHQSARRLATDSRARSAPAPAQVTTCSRVVVSAVDPRRHAATAQSARSTASARAALHDGESFSALPLGRGRARVDNPPLARVQSSPSAATRAGERRPELPRWPRRPRWPTMHGHRARQMSRSSGSTAGGRPRPPAGCVRTPLAQLGGRRYARAGLLASLAKGWGSFGVY